MRLIYFHMYGGNPFNGVNKKIFSQAFHLFELGIDFELVLIGGLNEKYPPEQYIKYLELPVQNYLKNGMITRFFRQYLARKFIIGILKQSNPGTILYLRYPFPTFLCPYDLLVLRKCKIIIECNSFEINEARERRDYFSYYRESIFGKEFRKRCDAIVGVTDEIVQHQLVRAGNSNKPHLTLGNGIDVATVPIRKAPLNLVDSTLEILFVANVSFWHGIDRLIYGIAKYRGKIEVYLHIVGYGNELDSLKKLVDHLGIKNRVIFEGFLSGEKLDALFDNCHIAVGSLGIHRIGLITTSQLKAREYCARGIPYIIACKDPDFPDNFPYILQIPADETPVDIERVIDFAKRISSEPDHSQKMRTYASKYLDSSIKMKNLKLFLESLVNES